MTDLAGLTTAAWVALVVGALVIGLSKTTVGGLVMVASAIFASVLPARASTGVVLLLLLVGDGFAIRAYARHADWKVLRPAAPWVLAGLACGAVFLMLAGDAQVKRTIGVILLLLSIVAIWRKLSRGEAHAEPPSMAFGAAAGLLSGFMTMVANAGAIFLLYLLRLRLPVLVFLGTSAWFFLTVNLVKLPLSIGLGLLTWHSVLLCLVLVPAVAVGAIVGRSIIRHISLNTFEWLVLVATLAASLNLLR